jgi:F-box protein 9
MSTLSGEAPDKTNTEEELERFRLEWQREVRERKAQAPKASELAQIHRAAALAKPDPFSGSKKRTNTGQDVVQESKGKGRASDFDSLKHQHDTPAIVPSIPEPAPQPQAGPSTSPKSQTSVLPGKPTKETKTKKSQKSALAVECYAKAVELEQMGQLNEALNLYRKAYKLER